MKKRGSQKSKVKGQRYGHTLFAIALTAAVLAYSAPVGGQQQPPASPVTGNATAGKQLYFDYACYACHGFNGETGARPFVPAWPASLSTEERFIALLRGRANVAPVQPSTAMPNYAAETLTDAQAKDIYAYIRTFRSNPPPIEKIPAMNEILNSAKRPYKP